MLYLFDECDNAGVWDVEIDVASLKIGEKLNEKKAIELFFDKVIVFDSGSKWFIPAFIDFQYGVLNPENRAHKSAIQILSKYNLIDNDYKILSPLRSPLNSPSDGAMDKDKDMDMDMVKDKDKMPHLFSKSEYFNKQKFKSAFAGTDYENYNLDYYYEAIANWSSGQGKTRKDWIAVTRTFMLGDTAKGIPQMKKGTTFTPNKTTANAGNIDWDSYPTGNTGT